MGKSFTTSSCRIPQDGNIARVDGCSGAMKVAYPFFVPYILQKIKKRPNSNYSKNNVRMMIRYLFIVCLCPLLYKAQPVFSIASSTTAIQKTQTVGAFYTNNITAEKGYTLFSPLNSTHTFLIDGDGKLINQWSGNDKVVMATLQEDGAIVRICRGRETKFKAEGIGGLIEKKNWNDSLLWEWELSDSKQFLHHTIKPLPNGHILAIMTQVKTLDQSIKAGRDTSKLSDKYLWSESVIEIKPIGKDSAKIVWQWNVWDHLIQDLNPGYPNFGIVQNHPELMDINFNTSLNVSADFLHFNSIDYNPKLDQILITVRNTNEVWIIDHSTTVVEAKGHKGGKAGKGGDLLYRCGNSNAYKLNEAAYLDGPCDARWIQLPINEGAISVFDSKLTTQKARVVILKPSFDKSTYHYPLHAGLLSPIIWESNLIVSGTRSGGCAQSLPNGNVLICQSANGKLIEVTPTKDTAWLYVNPFTNEGIIEQGNAITFSNALFRVEKYPLNYKGFTNKKLVPGATLELNPTLAPKKMIGPKWLETGGRIIISLANKPFIPSDALVSNTGQWIDVYNVNRELIDRQFVLPDSRWYLGIWETGTYYFHNKENDRVKKVILTK